MTTKPNPVPARPMNGGDVIRFLSPADARLARPGAGKRYRLECDGPHLLAFRNQDGTVERRYLRAEVERLAAAGRIVRD